MGSEIERELKKLLGGDLKALVRMKKTCDADESAGYDMMETYPFMVVRGAGSFGVDLVAIRGEMAFPIEVKSSKHPKLYLSQPRLKEQLETFLKECERANTFPVYAFRLKKRKGDPWRIFTVEMEGLRYYSRSLNDRIPKLRLTDSGNYVMEWGLGMSLSEFLMRTSDIVRTSMEG